METLIKIAAGLLVLGLGFTILDFCVAKLLRKMYPDPNYWNEELSSSDLSPEQRRRFQQRKRLYLNGVSHRFRKWGINLFLIGGLLLATSGVLHIFR